MELSQEQEAAVEAILKWYNAPEGQQHFVLCGYAGTGKTTLMNYLLDSIGNVTCATMTGKAMSVLKSKIGGKAICRTIHNLLYTPNMGQEQSLLEEREGLVAKLNSETRKTYQEGILKEIAEIDEQLNGLSFGLKEQAETEGGLIIVDEASMISSRVYADLMELGRPVLLVGDDMQLPPVQGKSIFAELGVDARLTQVHRQALDNPILSLATAIREGNADRVNQWKRLRFNPEMAGRADKVLCYTNKTRHNVNRMLRQVHGFTEPNPQKGDKLICTLNVRGYEMINGGEAVATTDIIAEDLDGKIIGKGSVSYEGKPEKELVLSLENFAAHYMDPKKNKLDRIAMDERTVPKYNDARYEHVRFFDYGYAITVHKAQGSEYDKVFLYDDAAWLGKKPGGMLQRQQWLYTAVTRAKEKLAWVS